MVVVEPRVHAAELGQAHRHVAVVEDDGHAEALAQELRDPAQVRHRDGEDDDRVDVALALEQRLEMLRQRGVTYRQITSRTALSARESSGFSSARRRYWSPLIRAARSRMRANVSASR